MDPVVHWIQYLILSSSNIWIHHSASACHLTSRMTLKQVTRLISLFTEISSNPIQLTPCSGACVRIWGCLAIGVILQFTHIILTKEDDGQQRISVLTEYCNAVTYASKRSHPTLFSTSNPFLLMTKGASRASPFKMSTGYEWCSPWTKPYQVVCLSYKPEMSTMIPSMIQAESSLFLNSLNLGLSLY